MVNYYKTILDYTGDRGAMPLLYSVRDGVPFAFPALMLGIFVLLWLGQYFLIKTNTGRSKILITALSSSFVCIILSMFLALAQLVTFMNVLFYAFLTIIIFILLLISDNS